MLKNGKHLSMARTYGMLQSALDAQPLPAAHSLTRRLICASPCNATKTQSSRVTAEFAYSISFRFFFCSAVRLVGYLILTPTTKSPLCAGVLLFGMPSWGNRSSNVGCVGPGLETLICLPSIVETVRFHPVNASFKSISRAM